jgi:hypothetical protein
MGYVYKCYLRLVFLEVQIFVIVHSHVAFVFDAARYALDNGIAITMDDFPVLAITALTDENRCHKFFLLS